MKFSDAVKAVQIRTYQLALEKLEDRLVPGETLGAALPLSSFVCPYLALLGADALRQDAPAPVVNGAVSAQVASQAPATQAETAAATPVAGDSGNQTVTAVPANDALANPSTDDADIQPVTLTPSASDLIFASDPASNTLAADPNTLEIASPAEVGVHASLSQGQAGDTLSSGALMGVSGSGLVVTHGVSAATGTAPGAVMSSTVNVDAGAAAQAASDGGAAPLLAGITPAASSPTGYSPAQMRHAYGFDRLTQTGAGITIGIVDAYDDPTVLSDLQTFDAQFGLPNPNFTEVFAQGSKPRTNGGWAQEISIDVQWAHAIAPGANIMLVECASNSNANLFGGVDAAVSHGAQVVSMSWRGGETSSEASLDAHFNHTGVAFLASSGDTGGTVGYPSTSPYVISVGGTNLPLDSSGNLTGSETTWSGSGGGASAFEAEPGYQTSYGITITGGKRGTPDVSYDADPNTGVSVFDSTKSQGLSGWITFGGTSIGAPQWAGLIALADQGRATPISTNNLSSNGWYSGATGSLYATDYRDITSGSAGTLSAGPGYDLVTGLGSPLANALVPYLNTH